MSDNLTFRIVVESDTGEVVLEEDFATQTGYLGQIPWSGIADAFRDYAKMKAELSGQQWFPVRRQL